MQPPKTLHITNAYHATSGGVRTFYGALLRHANAVGRPMRLVVPGSANRRENVGEHGLIYHVPAAHSPIADTRYRVISPLGSGGRAVREILRHERPDLLEVSDKYTLPLFSGFLRKGWIARVPRPVLVGTSHERMDHTTAAYFYPEALWRLISRIFMKQYYYPMFDWHMANSPYTAEELMRASRGHSPRREIRILPMGVDAGKFTPEHRTPAARVALASLAGVSHESKLLLYVGRLAAEKNLPLLVDTLERLPLEYHLVVAGDGLLKDWLQRASKRRLKGRLRLIGHIERDGIPMLFGGADAFIHPNPREPFGITPMEAMAAGLPLVAPDRGGVRSYATPENAWIAEPNPEAFAQAVLDVFRDDRARAEKARRARITALEHNWPRIAEHYFALYDEMVAQGDFWRSQTRGDAAA